MGLMERAQLVRMVKAEIKVKGNAPGKAVVIQGEGFDDQVITPEVYHAPGMLAVPPDGDIGLYIPIGSGRGVIVAAHNYRIEIDPGKGGTAIYSTTPDGETVKAKIVLKPDGTIEMNGDSKRLVTWGELDTALAAFKTSISASIAGSITGHTHVETGTTTAAGVGSAPAISLDISAAKTTTVKTGG